MYFCAAIAVFLLLVPTTGLNNSLGRTPQMGWNNWNIFSNDATADTMIDQAQKIKDSGLQALGYEYITMDDCWSDGRDSSGNLQPLAEKFPYGVLAVAEELHEMGFKWGMYSDAGTKTCAGYAGSDGYEAQDAKTFASWGVDYLKYDNCFHDNKSSWTRYSAMAEALKSVSRPMFLAMCSWGEDEVWTWGSKVANSWRMSGDVAANWGSVLGIINQMQGISRYGGPGGWNDMDMLEVGNGGLTDAEQVSHFSLWAALKSPLMMGNDLTTATNDTLSILGNAAVIAISQDPLGVPAIHKKISNSGEAQLWSGPLSGGDYVAVFFNPGDSKVNITATAAEIFDGDDKLADRSWRMYDLWADRYNVTASRLGASTSEKLSQKGLITVSVAMHSVAMFRLRSEQEDSGQLLQGDGDASIQDEL